eukprot:3937143-Pyramimonas_sp.AAC.1
MSDSGDLQLARSRACQDVSSLGGFSRSSSVWSSVATSRLAARRIGGATASRDRDGLQRRANCQGGDASEKGMR